MHKRTIEIALEKLDRIASTNDYLSELCKKEKTNEFYTVTTEFQTKGKGQRGNTWESEYGKNLLFSIVLYPAAFEVKKQFYLSMLTAVAISETLSEYADDFHIKWPNDIYWKNQKIGGILIENEIEGKYINQCIIGIGLNVNQETFTSNAPNPVSMIQILDSSIDRKALLEKIIYAIITIYQETEADFESISPMIKTWYINRLYRRKGVFPYRDNNGLFHAEFHQIEPSGHLLLKDQAGNIRRYAFKEIEFIHHETE